MYSNDDKIITLNIQCKLASGYAHLIINHATSTEKENLMIN